MSHSTRSRARRTSPPRSHVLAVAIGLVATLAGASLADAQATGSVARVGRSEIEVREYEDMTRQMTAAYRQANGKDVPEEEREVFRREVLEQLIRQRLLRAEAARLGIQVTDSQAEDFLRDDPYFQTNGRFDEARWAELATNAQAYRRALGDARDLLSGRRLLDQIRKQVTPSDPELRRLFDQWNGRALLNTVLVEKSWFEGGVEITPDALRAYYDSLTAALPSRREANLELFLVPVAGESSNERQWSAARARADSARQAIRGGTTFEKVAQAFGGIRSGGIWRSGDSGGIFYEDESLGERALRAQPGDVLPQPVRLAGGYGVVRVADRREMAIPSLAAAAHHLIEQYRTEWLTARARGELDSLRHAAPDSFQTGCATWHLALLDTATLQVEEPKKKDLLRWYEENPTLFARLDPGGRGLVHPPFEEVQELARATYLDAWRLRRAETLAKRIGEAWEKGKRDKKAEAEARVHYGLQTTFAAPPADLPPDLAEAAFGAPLGKAIVAAANRGSAVFVVTARDTACPYPDELAVETATRMLERAWREQKERAARALYEAEPDRFVGQPTYHYTYVKIDPRPHEIVDFEPGTIERYFVEHRDDFGEPEKVRGLQLLVATPPGSDTLAARQRAEALLARALAGEPFDSLVASYSDEPVTRAQGGDTGEILRNSAPAALRPLEDLLFSLRPGQVGGPVRTPYGYHLVQVTEYTPESFQDLLAVRATIGGRIALDRARVKAKEEGEAAARRFKTRAELVRWAEQHYYPTASLTWKVGSKALGPASQDEMRRTLQASDGHGMLPGAYYVGVSYYVAFVDSIQPPQPASWEEAREQALAEAEQDLELRAAHDAARLTLQEIEAGRSWTEATAPWGLGLQNMEYGLGYVVEGMGSLADLDSLLFGTPGRRLEPGAATFLASPEGGYLAQLVSRRMPTDAEFLVARDALRRTATERALYEYFEGLKKRYPVRILRADMDYPLPPPPPLSAPAPSASLPSS